jgi:hypothetical protein
METILSFLDAGDLPSALEAAGFVRTSTEALSCYEAVLMETLMRSEEMKDDGVELAARPLLGKLWTLRQRCVEDATASGDATRSIARIDRLFRRFVRHMLVHSRFGAALGVASRLMACDSPHSVELMREVGRWAMLGRDDHTSRLALLVLRDRAGASSGSDDMGDADVAAALAKRIARMVATNPARLSSQDSLLAGVYYEATGRLQDAGRAYAQYHGTQKYRVGQVDAQMNEVAATGPRRV